MDGEVGVTDGGGRHWRRTRVRQQISEVGEGRGFAYGWSRGVARKDVVVVARLEART